MQLQHVFEPSGKHISMLCI